MSECDRSSVWLLEASPEDLETPPDALRRHVEACDGCAGRLFEVRAALARVAEGLDSAGAGLDEAHAVRTALEPGADPVIAGVPRRWIRPAIRWAPIAAATALVLLLRGSGDPGTTAFGPWPETEPEGPFALSVEAPTDGRVAVFQARNPKIHVVWLY